jgi:DnaK suppressor protein
MEHLTAAQLATLRAKLEAELARLSSRMTTEARELAGTPSAEPGDIEDAAAEEAGRFRTNSLLGRDRAHIGEIEAALERMHDRSYGICEDSDDEIPYRRLELEPTARFTVEALAQRELEAGLANPQAGEPTGY